MEGTERLACSRCGIGPQTRRPRPITCRPFMSVHVWGKVADLEPHYIGSARLTERLEPSRK